MTLRVWALKNGELKPLSRSGKILLTARCAMRVEPWMPPRMITLWRKGLKHVVTNGLNGHECAVSAPTLAREISDRGAIACNRLEATDEPLGQCMSYAASTLAESIEASMLSSGPTLKKAVIHCAKLSASIAAILAHAGRVKVPRQQDPVELACVEMWDAIRADISTIATASTKIESARNPVRALRESSSLWPGVMPKWALRS